MCLWIGFHYLMSTAVVGAGYQHSVCVDGFGSVWVFGLSRYRGTEDEEYDAENLRPQKLSSLTQIISVACGEDYSLCLASTGTVHAFGENRYGQLGLGHNEVLPNATEIPGLPFITSVSCGPRSSFCIDENQKLWTAGKNDNGVLGLGHKNHQTKFIQVPDVRKIVKVACGGDFCFIMDCDGLILSSGSNCNGKLGLGDTVNRSTFTTVPTQLDIIQFSCGFAHSMFLTSEGEVYVLGGNNFGELGIGDEKEYVSSLTLTDLKDIKYISCGYSHSVCIDSKGTVFTCGYNLDSCLGNGCRSQEQYYFDKIPMQVCVDVLAISEFGNHTIIKDTRNIWVFGMNNCGQLGMGDKSLYRTPQKLPDEYFDIIAHVRKTQAKSARK